MERCHETHALRLEYFFYRETVDFGKSINGLVALIESDTDLPMGSGALFLLLYWDKTGFALWYKLLEKSQEHMAFKGEKLGIYPDSI